MLQYPRTPKLTAEEELQLVKAAQQGDLKARDAVIYNALGWTMFVLRNYVRRGGDDALQQMCVEIIIALQWYDTESGTRFCTYAAVYARNRLSNLFKRKQLRCFEFDADRDGASCDFDCCYEPRLQDALQQLPARYASVIARRYLNGLDETTVEIAASLGVKKQRVHQIEQSALEKMRVKLAVGL